MIAVGYALSAEEHGPRPLVANARRAEAAGFPLAAVSDHFHPWTDRQGESPFVWGVLGALAEATERMVIGTRVTCPTFRLHPAIVAHAAATAAVQLEGRFFLGVGSGEYLNEHVLGDPWPPVPERHARLEEAVGLMRRLWSGAEISHDGEWYQAQYARIHTRPAEPPPVLVAASGPSSIELAARAGDGIIGVTPDAGMLARYADAGGKGLRFGELHVCLADDDATARRTAREWWPVAALGGSLGSDLSRPSHFEAATEPLSEEAVAQSILCRSDPAAHVEAIGEYADAGYDAVWVHQVGPDQERFIDVYEREVLPAFDQPSFVDLWVSHTHKSTKGAGG